MVGSNLQTVVHRLHQLASEDGAGSAPDSDLLGRFIDGRDSAAFELLVWRHGAMVLATCGRLLGRGPDAEDAFQATFLALVRQARSIRKSESLGPWLHRVARRVSLHARQRNERRERIERKLNRPASYFSAEMSDLRSVVDEEVDRLPERLRRAVIVCYLEGHTTEDAARLLGVPRGTILSRLSRARDRLRGRFVRRGLAPAAGLVSGLTGDALGAALVETVVQNAVHLTNGSAALAPAVAALTEGVIRSMLINKIKITVAGMVLAVAMVGTGTVFVSRPGLNAQPPVYVEKNAKPGTAKPADAPSPFDSLIKKDHSDAEGDLKRLQGTWKENSVTENGAEAKSKGSVWKFGVSTVTVEEGSRKETVTMEFHINSSVEPKTIDFTIGDRTILGVYRLIGDAGNFSLRICLPNGKGPRPSSIDPAKGITVFILTPANEKNVKAPPVSDELAALREENQRLLAQLNVVAKEQHAMQLRAVEMERLATVEREKALADRDRALVLGKRSDEMAAIEKVERDRTMAVAQQMQAKFEQLILDKEKEIELLRAKMPLDKWDAGWSEVMVKMPNSWGIRILADGSGIYGFGAKFDDFCTFPAGTFTFDKVRRDLLARSKIDHISGECVVELRRKSEQNALIVYTPDAQFISGLLQMVHAKAATPSINQVWGKTPPMPGQPATGSNNPFTKP